MLGQGEVAMFPAVARSAILLRWHYIMFEAADRSCIGKVFARCMTDLEKLRCNLSACRQFSRCLKLEQLLLRKNLVGLVCDLTAHNAVVFALGFADTFDRCC